MSPRGRHLVSSTKWSSPKDKALEFPSSTRGGPGQPAPHPGNPVLNQPPGWPRNPRSPNPAEQTPSRHTTEQQVWIATSHTMWVAHNACSQHGPLKVLRGSFRGTGNDVVLGSCLGSCVQQGFLLLRLLAQHEGRNFLFYSFWGTYTKQYSGIIPGGFGEPYWVLEIQIMLTIEEWNLKISSV